MMNDKVERPPLGWWIGILGGLGFNALVGFNDGAYAMWCSYVTSFLSQGLIRFIFVAGVAAHVGEAIYAWRIARQAGLRTAGGWALQTFLIGFPSLGRLQQRVSNRLL
jgi:hypothetical protein